MVPAEGGSSYVTRVGIAVIGGSAARVLETWGLGAGAGSRTLYRNWASDRP